MEKTIEEKTVGDLTMEETIVDKIQVVIITTTTIITTRTASDKMNQMIKQQ